MGMLGGGAIRETEKGIVKGKEIKITVRKTMERIKVVGKTNAER